MITRDFCGNDVSVLAMGCMRLPVIDGDDAAIDEPATVEMIDYAYKHGVNYFDTAWGYHGGNSEVVVGQALSQYPRDSYYLATKWPGYDTNNFGCVEEIFEKQLEKCGVDYFDYYLLHNVCELNVEKYLDDERFKTVSYLIEQRKAGRIKHLGFSVHGAHDAFSRFLDVYGDEMEFCQIQLNYLDWSFQNAQEKVEMLNARGIPIIVMEPLRGGNLIAFTDEQAAKLEELHPQMSAPEWALRYVAGVEGVSAVLTGASTFEQLAENIEIFETDVALTDAEIDALYEIADEFKAQNALPCTACHYCTSHCPMNLDIPYLIDLYNENKSRPDGRFIAPMALAALPEDKRPGACIACRACEGVCPQQIAISDAFVDFAKMLAG